MALELMLRGGCTSGGCRMATLRLLVMLLVTACEGMKERRTLAVVLPGTAVRGSGRLRSMELLFHPPVLVTGAINTSLYHSNNTVQMLSPSASFMSNFFAVDDQHVFGQLMWYGGVMLPSDGVAGRYAMYVYSSDGGSTWGKPPSAAGLSGGTPGSLPEPVPPGWLPSFDGGADGWVFRPHRGDKLVRAASAGNQICACQGDSCINPITNMTAGCMGAMINNEPGSVSGGIPGPPWVNFSSSSSLDFSLTANGTLMTGINHHRTLFYGVPKGRAVLGVCGSQFGKKFQTWDWQIPMQNAATLADGTLITVLLLCQGDRYQNWIFGRLNFSMYSLNAFASVDGGDSWEWRATVANAADFPESGTGPQSETDVVALADGKTLLTVTRMDGDGPCHLSGEPHSESGTYRYYYESYSTDQARTWTKARPMNTDRVGCVWPRLLTFGTTDKPGPVVLSGGRICVENQSGLFLWANEGMARAPGTANEKSNESVWKRISVSNVHNQLWTGDSAYRFDEGINASDLFETMTYTALIQLTPTSALLTYNRFYHPGNGVGGCQGSPAYPCGSGFSMRIDYSDRPISRNHIVNVCPNSDSFPDLSSGLSEIRALRQAGDLRVAEIVLCSGVHVVHEPLRLNAMDSNVRWRSRDPKSPATVSGRAQIMDWSKTNAGTWEAQLPAGSVKIRQLWGPDGKRRKRQALEGASCGDKSEYAKGCNSFELPDTARAMNLTASPPGEFPGFTANDTFPLRWRHTDNVEAVWSRSGVPWTEFRCRVNYTDQIAGGFSRIVLDSPCWHNLVARSGCRDQPGTCNPLPRRFESIPYAGSAARGTFFVNTSSRKIQYTPLLDEAMSAKSTFTVVAAEQLLISSTGLANITLTDIIFEHAGQFDPISTPLGFVDVQAGYHQSGPPVPESPYWGYNLEPVSAALRFQASHNVVITNCTFQHLGSSGIAFEAGSQNCTVEHSTFFDISGSALLLGGIYDSSERDTTKQTAGQTVADSVFIDVAAEFHSCACIMVGYSRNTRLLHNLMWRLPYTGISLSWGWGVLSYAADNEVAFNEIDSAMCGELVDGGSVYTLGPQPGSTVHHNYLHSQCSLYGVIYHDGGSGYFNTFDNVIANSTNAVWVLLNPDPVGEFQPPLRVHENWVDKRSTSNPFMVNCKPTQKINCTVVDTMVVPDNGSWPDEAKAVIHGSGPRKYL